VMFVNCLVNDRARAIFNLDAVTASVVQYVSA
jgi:hypothetical protein